MLIAFVERRQVATSTSSFKQVDRVGPVLVYYSPRSFRIPGRSSMTQSVQSLRRCWIPCFRIPCFFWLSQRHIGTAFSFPISILWFFFVFGLGVCVDWVDVFDVVCYSLPDRFSCSRLRCFDGGPESTSWKFLASLIELVRNAVNSFHKLWCKNERSDRIATRIF